MASGDDLPNYSPPQGNVNVGAPTASTATPVTGSEYECSLENSKGQKWLTLWISSRTPNPKAQPLFFTGDSIKGRIQINVDKQESSKGITVSVSANAIINTGYLSIMTTFAIS